MEDRRLKMMMNWDGLGDEDEDDHFFESFDRISSVVSVQLASSGSDEDDEEYDDSRISFASAMSSAPSEEFCGVAGGAASSMAEDYNIWMAEPGSIKERRKRLLQGMGLSGDKELHRLTTAEFKRSASRKSVSTHPSPLIVSMASIKESKGKSTPKAVLGRSRSDAGIESASVNAKWRREEITGSVSTPLLRRSSSALSTLFHQTNRKEAGIGSKLDTHGHRTSSLLPRKPFGAFFVIKNLDTGKEFIVNEFDENGKLNRLSDLQTGKELSMEEFDKYIGYSPIVKELMRRENVSAVHNDSVIGIDRKVGVNYLGKSFKFSKRRGVAWLKNIKDVANTMSGLIGDREREHHSSTEAQSANSPSSGWTKVRQHGKSYKELTGLHKCQEIQAHQGSIWTIKFSHDALHLASAGEDRVIHIWEVRDCDDISTRLPEETNSTLHTMACSSPEQHPQSENASILSERKGSGRASSTGSGKASSTSIKTNSIPDYVIITETIFSLSEKPVCSFQGHLDDILDLSWSKSQVSLFSSFLYRYASCHFYRNGGRITHRRGYLGLPSFPSDNFFKRRCFARAQLVMIRAATTRKT